MPLQIDATLCYAKGGCPPVPVDADKKIVGVISQADLALERKAVGEKDLGKVLEKISEPAGVR